MNETHAKAMLGLTAEELLDLKKVMQELHDKEIQGLIHQAVAKRVLKESRIAVVERAISQGSFANKVLQAWESESNRENVRGALVWLLVQVQYQKTRPTSSLSALESLETCPTTSSTPWYVPGLAKPLTPAAKELYRAIIFTRNTVSGSVSVCQVNELPSHRTLDRQGTLSEEDWTEWQSILTADCEFYCPQDSMRVDTTVDELHCDREDGFNGIDSMASHPDTPMDLDTVIDPPNPGAVPTASTEAQDPQDGPTQVMDDRECDSTPAHIVVERPVSRTTSAPTKDSEIQNEYPPASPSEIQKERRSPDVEMINGDDTLPLDTGYEFLDEVTQLGPEPQTSDEGNTEQVDPAELIKPGRFRCEQMDSQTWRDFTSFFMLPQNENDGTDPTRKILIRGMLRDAPPHQLYCAFWMLLKDQGLEQGGFIADEMGIGKTMEVILYFVLGAWIIYNRLHIKQCRKDPAMANKHLPAVMDTEEGHKGPKQHHLRCPSQDMFPILCACVPDGVTARCLSQPLQGAMLVVVPKGLLLPWAREWADSIPGDSGNCLKLNLFIGHGDLTPTKVGNLGHAFIQTAQHATLRQHDLGPQQCYRHMFLTTPGSLSSRVMIPLHDIQKQDAQQLRWRAVIRDECHQEKGFDSKTIRQFREINSAAGKQGYAPATWLLSGTPYDKGPTDMLSWMTILATAGWENDARLQFAQHDQWKTLSARVQLLISKKQLSRTDQIEFRSAAHQFGQVLECLMIRRTTETSWFNKPIMELPPNRHHDVLCSLEPKVRDELQRREEREIQKLKDSYMRSLQEWKKHGQGSKPELSSQTFFKKSRINRIIAIFPALLDLMKTEQRELKLTDEEMMENGWHAGGDKEAPYIHAIDALANSSSKCRAIQHILQGMGRDYRGRPEKIVILTEFPRVVHMLEVWLQKQGYCVAAVYSSMSVEDRDTCINAFNRDLPLPGGETDASPGVLISTLEILGVGYTCVRAFRLILLSPSWLERDEAQGKARIRRYGQMNEATYTYRLVCRDVQVESNILDRQAMRKSFNELAMSLQREVGIVPDIIDLDTGYMEQP
ncbi:SNF2 family N-terminal domain containing protein [Coccidioides posadasii C735 delta SOWgp]|uniref:SNF2 family N-terminal domain containing protein n=1 Tax=Coccidioides posadasii (strain C735) TaxID=222929 RepID=C5PJQ2_COCP7|nr:SNF2 family N-terminal domain containing protein [Coccidioides posadasii C735 delta SOWgp]EER22853.1 SNF2 family N-terminal domain containing protein [Coccidioides posadasii C735 delta SOWgp]|eukprot:XP_003064998.1 SNF2 family N-terminal domain containing protein [Coccidioides posadasii C735 delta SOWgp]